MPVATAQMAPSRHRQPASGSPVWHNSGCGRVCATPRQPPDARSTATSGRPARRQPERRRRCIVLRRRVGGVPCADHPGHPASRQVEPRHEEEEEPAHVVDDLGAPWATRNARSSRWAVAWPATKPPMPPVTTGRNAAKSPPSTPDVAPCTTSPQGCPGCARWSGGVPDTRPSRFITPIQGTANSPTKAGIRF